MSAYDGLGADWLKEQTHGMVHKIPRMGPVEYNEKNRYLPAGLTPRPGYIRFDLFPFLREILECFDPKSPVREVDVEKGVQTGFTTLLESVAFYLIGYIKTEGGMFITAEKELADLRMDNNIIPMLNQSGLGDLIRSSDEGNSRKTGKTSKLIQWDGGGFLVPQGAQNATKMRMTSVPWMFKDELDGWPRDVGQDGNSDGLTDDRLSAYWNSRKILRGSTPTVYPSMIDEAYERGDKRHYYVLCKACSFPQVLRMEHVNEETGVVGGFKWDTQAIEGVDQLVLESVRYVCPNCSHEHYETDKERLFATEHGAHWKPTATPRLPDIRSYHLPAFYSPYGFRPWSKCVSDYVESYDTKEKKVTSPSRYQKFYNNVLGKPFRVTGSRVRFESASAHRRMGYAYGQVPNKYAAQYSGSKILFLTMQVDVHLRNLAVTVMGWTVGMRCYTVDYWRLERAGDEDDCGQLSSPVWQKVRDLIEKKRYKADDGTTYGIARTYIDAGYSNDTVCTFCSDYDSGVYPILGRQRAAKNQTVKEFGEFTTQIGTVGYRVNVDHYKDRLAPVLRRTWDEARGVQDFYHFNAPVDVTEKQIKELTVEVRREKADDNGNTFYVWHRPGNAPNEFWDLLVYGDAGVEIWAWQICVQYLELDKINWDKFWEYAASSESDAFFCRS